MEQLIQRLKEVPRSYDGFVFAIADYAMEKESRITAINDFLNQNPTANSSDVVKFVSDQPDFFEDDTSVEKVG